MSRTPPPRRARRALLAIVVATAIAAAGQASADPIVAREATINLQITRAVRTLLREEGLKVFLTRRADRTLHPTDRTGLANRKRVDAFVSIHNNASTTRSAAGTIVFHSIRRDGSKRFGDRIRDAFVDEFGPARSVRLTTRRGCCGDYYYQLRWSRMPAVLVEGAFVSNPYEGKRLASDPSFRRAIARSIADGVLRFQRTLVARSARARDPGIVVPGAAAPPTEAKGRALGATRVRLRWTAQAFGASSYRIYRDGALIGSTRAQPGERVRFTDRTAAPGQDYVYEIRTTETIAGDVDLHRESVGARVEVRTPAMSIVLDPGHGGRDPGALYRY